MEDKRLRWVLLTAIAPIVWGSVYYVTRHYLPPGVPLWGGVFRALPAGVLLLLIVRRLPTGSWWLKVPLLGVLNVGGFFALVYIAGTRLPSSLAATLMSTSAAALILFGWLFLRQRPRLASVLGAVIGIGGVLVMFGPTGGDPVGIAASLGAMLSSAVGFVLTAKWGAGISPIALAAWQLTAGALILLPFAFVFEGAPPVLTAQQVIGFGYISLVATALAYVVWFTGFQRLSAGTVGVIGLLNPVSGVLLGVVLGGEAFGRAQTVGMALVVVGVLIGAGIRPLRRSVVPASAPVVPAVAPR